MAKVTSKLQVTIPKQIADRYAIAPGDEIEFVAAGDGIRILPASKCGGAALSDAERLRLFRAATARQRTREKRLKVAPQAAERGRGWTREELHDRGKPR
jgi:AbrB family looped-hinge helix DNA binding protein